MTSTFLMSSLSVLVETFPLNTIWWFVPMNAGWLPSVLPVPSASSSLLGGSPPDDTWRLILHVFLGGQQESIKIPILKLQRNKVKPSVHE